VPQAWRTYPAFPLDAPGQAPAVDGARARKLLADDGKALEGTSQVALPSAPAKSASAEDRLAYAAAMAERGDDSAAGLLQALIDDKEAPQAVRGRAANDLGNFMTIGKRYKDAARSYESALKNGVDKASVEHNLGVAWYNAGDGAEAKKHFQKSGTDEDKQLMKKLGLAMRDPGKKANPTVTTGKTPPPAGKAPVTVDNSASDEGIRAGRELDPRDALIWLGRK
jgi:tetratricopeptide (TPR) repeat protein